MCFLPPPRDILLINMILSFIFLEDTSTLCSISFLSFTNVFLPFCSIQKLTENVIFFPTELPQCQWNVVKQLCMGREYGEKHCPPKTGNKRRRWKTVKERFSVRTGSEHLLVCLCLFSFFLNPLEMSSWFHQMSLKTSTYVGKCFFFSIFFFV